MAKKHTTSDTIWKRPLNPAEQQHRSVNLKLIFLLSAAKDKVMRSLNRIDATFCHAAQTASNWILLSVVNINLF